MFLSIKGGYLATSTLRKTMGEKEDCKVLPPYWQSLASTVVELCQCGGKIDPYKRRIVTGRKYIFQCTVTKDLDQMDTPNTKYNSSL